jgi:ATP synthase protein I
LNLPSPDNGDLRDLGERIDEVRRREESRKVRPPNTPWGIVLRFGTELLAAIIAGVAIGLGLDWVFGTRPVFMLVMFMFGGAAGIRNVIVLAKKINEQAMKDLAGKPTPPPVADDEED